MLFHESDPNQADWMLQTAARAEQLPQSQAFEQVLYDNLSSRITTFRSEDPIAFHPILLRTQFPEALKDKFPNISNFIIDNLQATQTIEPTPPVDGLYIPGSYVRSNKMVFSHNDVQYIFTSNGEETVLSVKHENGESSCMLSHEDYIAFLASLVYAVQYEPGNPDNGIHLEADPLIFRSDVNEGLIEQCLLTLGNIQGNTNVRTQAAFETDSQELTAELVTIENPRISGVNNMMSLFEKRAAATVDTNVHQNGVSVPTNLENHYATIEQRATDTGGAVYIEIDPSENLEAWATCCAELLRFINPQLTYYEELEESHD